MAVGMMSRPGMMTQGPSRPGNFGFGGQAPGPGGPGVNPVNEAFDTYGNVARRQFGDYGDIMNRYGQFYNDLGNTQNQIQDALNQQFNKNPVTLPNYEETADYRNAITNQRGLAETGGYSQADIANIRERGISPIRSVYANAQQNLQRQRSLQGGYSPNYTAVSAKMAREMSSQLSDQTTNVNAQIAQNVAQNRLAASQTYTGTTAGEQESRNAFALKRAELGKDIGLTGAGDILQSFQIPIQGRANALSGMTNLFGTEPGFTNTMQRGALNTATLQGNMENANRNRGLQAISYGLTGGR